MRKVVLFLMALLIPAVAIAAVEVQSRGTRVNNSETVNFVGPTVSGSGTATTVDFSTMTGAVTWTGAANIVGNLEVDGAAIVDGTIYTATLTVDGGIYPGRATGSPCATLGAGHVFFNNSTGVPCYCGNNNLDYAIYSATARCF